MKPNKHIFKFTFLAILFAISLQAIATPLAIPSKYYIDLNHYTGISYLQTMIDKEDGVVLNFNSDYEDTYEFATSTEVDVAIDNFDDKNKKRILRMFKWDRKLLKTFVNILRKEEKTFDAKNVNDKVGRVLSQMKLKGDKYSLGQFIAIASGAGTLIRIDENNYFYNVGYFAPEVRSGRSYGATTLHNANDASHLMYLRELEKLLKSQTNHRIFYTAVMKFLVDTDVSIYKDQNFDLQAEAVLTDYITVYTAELRRHLMRGLSPRSAPWGNDMTEATFLSFFNVKTGLMSLDEGLVESRIKEHWALSKSGSGRSGFGINRKPRRKLQAQISNYFRYNDDQSKRSFALNIDKLIGKRRDGDIYRGVMEYLNNKKNLINNERVESIEVEIVSAFVDFLMQVNEDSKEIVNSLR
jgi:hypothetical protein